MVKDEPEGIDVATKGKSLDLLEKIKEHDQDVLDRESEAVKEEKAKEKKVEAKKPKKKNSDKEGEKLIEKLRKETEISRGVEDKPFVDIEIPLSGKLGESFEIRVPEKVNLLEVVVSDDVIYEIKNKVWNRGGDREIFGRPVFMKKAKNVDVIKLSWEDPQPYHDTTFNALPAGEYLIEARASNQEEWQETVVKRIINVKK